jgi:hypothetical protein
MKWIRHTSRIFIGLYITIACSGCYTEIDSGYSWTLSIGKTDLITDLPLIQSESMGPIKWISVWIAN